MPIRLRKRLIAAAELSGEKPLKLLEKLIALYERNFSHRETTLNEREERLIKLGLDPVERSIFRRVMAVMGTAAASSLSREERVDRAAKGGAGRAKQLSAAEKKKHAQAMAKKRWGTKNRGPDTQTPPE